MYYLGLLLEELTRPGQFPWDGTVGNLQPVSSIFRPGDILTCVCVCVRFGEAACVCAAIFPRNEFTFRC